MWPACSHSINGENPLLVTDQSVEFEKERLKFKISWKSPTILEEFTSHTLKWTSKNQKMSTYQKMSTCNWSDLEALEYLPMMPKNIPRHCSYSQRCYTNAPFPFLSFSLIIQLRQDALYHANLLVDINFFLSMFLHRNMFLLLSCVHVVFGCQTMR